MRITNKTIVHSEKPIPVYCLEVPKYHNFSCKVEPRKAVVHENCKMYNLDFDGDQIAVYFMTDKDELIRFGDSIRIENFWFWDKDHKPAYLPTSTTIYGLYAATKIKQPEGKRKEFDSLKRMEEAFNADKLDVDEQVLLLPNKLTTYGREKLSEIVGKPIETLIELKPMDQDAVDKLIRGLQHNPDRQRIMNNLRDFGDEIATLTGISNLPLEDLYKNISPEIDAIAADPQLSEEAKVQKIYQLLPKRLDERLAEVPNSNIDILTKGSRIDGEQLRALYVPYVRFDEDSKKHKLKIGDSSIIAGQSEEEYVTAAHEQRKILEVKADAVPRAGWNREQLVVVSVDILFRKKKNNDKSYVYIPESLAKKDLRTIAHDAPAPRGCTLENGEKLVAVYSCATSSDNNVYEQQVSRYTYDNFSDGSYIGMAYSDSMAETFYQMELKLKYGGLLNDFSKEDIYALSSGVPKQEGDFIVLDGYRYRLGEGIVPSEAVDKGLKVTAGKDRIAINCNLVNINKRFSAFYTVFQLKVASERSGFRGEKELYNPIGISYAPCDGTIHYRNNHMYLDNLDLGELDKTVTYLKPDGWKVHYAERLSSLTLDVSGLLNVCAPEYATFIFYKELCRMLQTTKLSYRPDKISNVLNSDMADILLKILSRSRFSVKDYSKNREDDFVMRQVHGSTGKGLKDNAARGINYETMETSIKLPKDNPILKILMRVREDPDEFYQRRNDD